MSSSNLAPLGYPQIDKICDAKFVKNATGFKAKKDLVSFVEQSEKTQIYFDIKEKEIKQSTANHQQDLRDFFKTIEDDITEHKKKAKEVEQKKEKMAYEDLKQKIIAEWQQEEAEKSKKAEMEAKIHAKIMASGKKLSIKNKPAIVASAISSKEIQNQIEDQDELSTQSAIKKSKFSFAKKKTSSSYQSPHQSLADLTQSSDSEGEDDEATQTEPSLNDAQAQSEDHSASETIGQMKLSLTDYHQIAQELSNLGIIEIVSTSMKPLAIQCVICDEPGKKIRFIVS